MKFQEYKSKKQPATSFDEVAGYEV